VRGSVNAQIAHQKKFAILLHFVQLPRPDMPRKAAPDLEVLRRLLSPYCRTFTLGHLRSFDEEKWYL